MIVVRPGLTYAQLETLFAHGASARHRPLRMEGPPPSSLAMQGALRDGVERLAPKDTQVGGVSMERRSALAVETWSIEAHPSGPSVFVEAKASLALRPGANGLLVFLLGQVFGVLFAAVPFLASSRPHPLVPGVLYVVGLVVVTLACFAAIRRYARAWSAYADAELERVERRLRARAAR